MLQEPRGGAGNGTATADGRQVSIGTVLALLRDEFPEVTISKIRFLEAEGLVEPERTPSGYRKFSPEDVERLAQVLRMQRDHYLPLKVIREHLDALERGEQAPPLPAEQQRATLDDSGEAAEAEARTAARVGRAELLAAAQVGEEALDEWESYGLIAPTVEDGYDIEAVQIAKLVAELGRFGIEPRHLRGIKASAEREAGLVDQVLAPLRRHRNPQTRTRAEARAQELAGLTGRLHAALVQAALRVRP
ncbi:transcriptional regulator FtsR [Streptomyces sp. NBC_01304]|uniref:transcriptional regulator FtsR n=1 Tax=Streptomyces sp. NBC_01304 TaxID=2903818 RepID=UPI002E1299A8|nr:MerR family transcriptional regulator [Streptomyces sp. NBC_01304]